MLRPQGYLVGVSEEGVVREADTFTCAHCQTIVVVKPGASASAMGGWCRLCDKPVCPRCSSGACVPFEKKLEAMERRR